MRNIKSTLRFARNSALLFVAASGVTYLTGCQSENGLNSGNQNATEPAVGTDTYTVFSSNPNRVRNYGSKGTRDGEFVNAVETFTMPACPEVPENIKTTTGIGTNDGYKLEAGVDFLIPEGETFDAAFKPTAKYYVAGTYNCTNGFWDPQGAKPEIYVLPGGTLNIGSTLQPGITIYNYGTIISDNLCVAAGVKLYSDVDITEVKNFMVNGAEDGQPAGEFYSKASIMSDGNIQLNGVAVACMFDSQKAITLNEGGTIKASYFKGADITFHGAAVEIDNNGIVEADNLFISNADTDFSVNGTNAVVYAKKFTTNNKTWAQNTFGEGIACHFDECYIATEKIPFNDLELVYSSEDQVVFVPREGCHGSMGKTPDGEISGDEEEIKKPDPEKPILEIKKVADIAPLEDEDGVDHDHGHISATCINFGNDNTKAYASYHLRGNGTTINPVYPGTAQKGCIEVIEDNGSEISLKSFMISPDYDFNHIIVDGNNIITVGNHAKKGAFIGSLPISFEASQGVRNDFKVKEITTDDVIQVEVEYKDHTSTENAYKNAGDGNCVVRQGDYYYVATYRGYGALTTDFKKVEGTFHNTPGSCKHISVDNGNIAILAHDTYDKTESSASVYTGLASDHTFANVLKAYDNVGTISPVDGKNVIAMDGNEIYVCLSKGGLVRVSDKKKFQRGKNGQVPVNGMAFDDKYIYVANGSFVSVLDKATMEELCYYHASSQKSANYIALRNGKIYVAFGEDGIQVFQLVEKTISQN